MKTKSNVVSIKLNWGMDDASEKDLITKYLVEVFNTANPREVSKNVMYYNKNIKHSYE